MFERGQILRTDPFTFTVGGEPWIDQQWGAQLLLALAFRGRGWPTMVILRAALLSTLSGLIYSTCRRGGAGRRPSAIATIGAFLVAASASGALALRPQLFGAVLFAAVNRVLWQRPPSTRALSWIPGLTVIWANLHGSFPLALLLCSLVLCGNLLGGLPVRPMAVTTVVTAAATFASPFGPDAWTYVARILRHPVVQTLIGEWKSPDLASPAGIAMIASLILITALVIRAPRDVPPWVLLQLLALAALSLRDQRPMLWWALAAGPAAAALSRADLPDPTLPRRLAATTVPASVVALCVLALPWWRDWGKADTRTTLVEAPIGVTAAVQEHTRPGTRLSTSHLWASWFEFALPRRPLFVDSRIELFPVQIWRDYITVTFASPGWQDVLRRWHVEAVAASWEQQSSLILALRRQPGWAEVYVDDEGAVFLRTSASAPGRAG